MTIQLPRNSDVDGKYLSRYEADISEPLDIMGKYKLEDGVKIKGHKLIPELVY